MSNSWKVTVVAIIMLAIFAGLCFAVWTRNPVADCVYGGYVPDHTQHNIFGARLAVCNPAPNAR